ncbi:DUF45 domain-containing protein, partial [Lacticaseibacillus rhamnosus]
MPLAGVFQELVHRQRPILHQTPDSAQIGPGHHLHVATGKVGRLDRPCNVRPPHFGQLAILYRRNQQHVAAALERWYRRLAREEVTRRLDRACSHAGLAYTNLTIRGQRTRWASCSRNGARSFNWR